MNKETEATLRDQPLFIGGHPKSGTSLVRSLLDAHPQLVVYPEETAFFRRYLPRATNLDRAGQIALAEETLLHIFTWNQDAPPPSQEGFLDRDYSTISFEAVRQAMADLLGRHGLRHPGDILSAAVLAFGQVSGHWRPEARYWVEKSPYNEYYAGQIFAWWPAARMIHVVRDPRDNYVSYQRKHRSWQAEFFASNWRRSTQAAFDNQTKHGRERYLLLRYEDLVQTPEQALQQVCAFLEIENHPALTQPSRAGQDWEGNSMFAQTFQGISAAPAGRWTAALSSREATIIEWIARVQMEKAGYAPSATRHLGGILQANAWPLTRRINAALRRIQPHRENEDA